MKVAYFIGSLNRGGAETLMLDVCRQYESAPYIFICVYRHDGTMSDDFKATKTPLIRVPKETSMLRYIWTLRRTFLNEHVSIVHSQTPSNTLLLSVALLGTGIKIITTFHGHTFASDKWWKRRIVYSTSDTILCVSRFEKSFYEQKWNLPKHNKLQVVYNGIDFSKLDDAKNERVRDLSGDRLKLAMVGNFVRGRSQIIVAKSIAALKEKGITDFEFYFIGRRDEHAPQRYDNCVNYCEEHKLMNVHFLGARNDVPAILHSIDGFVYSTEHDTFGIAVIEAVAAGLPVVVNDWHVMIEVCDLGLPQYNRSIRFFKTEDIEDCAQQIQSLLDDLSNNRAQLQSDCLLASESAKQKYAIQTHMEQLLSIYQSFI